MKTIINKIINKLSLKKNRPIVILLSGKARSGKDTVAQIFKEELENKNKKVLIIHNATRLKSIIKNYFNWNGEKDEIGRQLLQYVGTDVIRKKKPSFWVDSVIEILLLFPNKWDFIIIPDTRFPNEISKMKKKFKTKVYRIERENKNENLTNKQQLHKSETALDHFNFKEYINNNHNLEWLKNSIKLIIKNDNFYNYKNN